MAMISVTRLHVRSIRFLMPFMIDSRKIARQATRAPGFLSKRLAVEPYLGFWTLTAWQDEMSMRGFRNSGSEPGYLLAILGGTDAGRVVWSKDVLERAKQTGLTLDAKGNLNASASAVYAAASRSLSGAGARPATIVGPIQPRRAPEATRDKRTTRAVRLRY